MAHEIGSKKRTEDVITRSDVTFGSFGLKDPIKNGLIRCGFVNPSPIQLLAIPEALIGVDLVIQSKSGTGKTVVFVVTILQTLSLPSTCPQVLIIAPTREIASQIAEVVTQIGRVTQGLSVKTFVGGIDLQVDKKSLKTCNVVVGTPGRIKQLLDCKLLNASAIRLLVLDEADKLMEQHFINDVNGIFEYLPQKKQMIATSATYPDNLSSFLTKYMKTPKEIRLGSKDPSLLGVSQYYSLVESENKKFDKVVEILNTIPFSQAMIFCNNRDRTRSLLDLLLTEGHAAGSISGDMSTKERVRKMEEFKTKNIRALISTDLCSRGIDSEHVDLVFNLDIPFGSSALETYFHRIGRSGRFGSSGIAITVLVMESNETMRFFKLVRENDLKVNQYSVCSIPSASNHSQEYSKFVDFLKEEKKVIKGLKISKSSIKNNCKWTRCPQDMNVEQVRKANRIFVKGLIKKKAKKRRVGHNNHNLNSDHLQRMVQAIFPTGPEGKWKDINLPVFCHFLNPFETVQK